MITEPTALPAPAPPPLCDTRLATRISEPVDRRLRLAALVRRVSLSHLLDHLLDQALPPVGELAEQIQGRLTCDDSTHGAGLGPPNTERPQAVGRPEPRTGTKSTTSADEGKGP